MAMEDFRVDIIVGKGPGATSKFRSPCRDSRSLVLQQDLACYRPPSGPGLGTPPAGFYSVADLQAVVGRSASTLGAGWVGGRK